MDRVEILKAGAKLTSGERDKAYGDPRKNLGLAGELKEVFRRGSTRQLSFAEQEAIDMVLTKIARVGTGSSLLSLDTYIDGATYFAIAGEVSQPASIPEALGQKAVADALASSKVEPPKTGRPMTLDEAKLAT